MPVRSKSMWLPMVGALVMIALVSIGGADRPTFAGADAIAAENAKVPAESKPISADPRKRSDRDMYLNHRQRAIVDGTLPTLTEEQKELLLTVRRLRRDLFDEMSASSLRDEAGAIMATQALMFEKKQNLKGFGVVKDLW